MSPPVTTAKVELPPEIWLTILEIATFTSDPPSYDWLATKMRPDGYNRRYDHLRKALITKRQVVKVCWLWNNLATRFLYERVVLSWNRGHRALVLLRRTLEESRPSNGRSLGLLVQHLDFAPWRSYDVSCGNLTEVLRYLPKLAFFTFFPLCIADSRRLPSALIRSLAESCGKSLQVLNLCRPHFYLSGPDFHLLVSLSPNLRAMRWRYESEETTVTLLEPLPTLPHLTVLYLDPIYDQNYTTLFRNPLPSLRRIITDARFHDIVGRWTPFFNVFGHQITHFQIYQGNRGDSSVTIQSITRLCPNLTRLDILVDIWDGFMRDLVVPPKVKVLGITCFANQASNPAHRRFVEALQTLKFGSALKSVQLMDCRMLFCLRQQHYYTLSVIRQYLRKFGVNLEDYKGALL